MFKTHKFLAIAYLLVAVAGTFFFCSRDYNPFADMSNANVHVLSWTFSGQDSVPVYSTGTLKLVVGLREEVDSISVSALKNRFWDDTTIKRTDPGIPIKGSPFNFNISFYDTGSQTVTIKTFRSNGDVISLNLMVQCYNPLRQNAVYGIFGDTTILGTDSVVDKDVFYVWEFGEGRTETWPTYAHKTVFSHSTLHSGTGYLVVKDYANSHSTPPLPFLYSFSDTGKPVIFCVNDSLKNDTLYIRDSILAFQVYIADQGQNNSTVDSCSVNDTSFDLTNQTINVYTKVFKNLPVLSKNNNAFPIHVYAMDNLQSKNVSRDTFYVVYSAKGNQSLHASITFNKPDVNNSISNLRSYDCIVTVDNYRSDTLNLRVMVNDSLYSLSRQGIGLGHQIGFPLLYLDTVLNTVTVYAYNATNNLVASAKTTIVYDSTFGDKLKPKIYEISTTDGYAAGNLHTAMDSVILKVVAFDIGGRIKSLTINGIPQATDSASYMWYWSTGKLSHGLPANIVHVVAQDVAGNTKDTTISIFRNSVPVLASDPMIPSSFCIDSSYSFRLSVFDGDGDSVTIIKKGAPATMGISKNGTVLWKPGINEIGVDSLEVQLDDGYEKSSILTWKFTVSDCKHTTILAHFTTKEQDFPSVLQVGKDTLRVKLSVDQKETAPFYTALFKDNNNVILSNDTSGNLVWIPTLADTGLRKLLVTVGNGFTGLDTLAPSFWVVPRNQYPCSLSYTFTGSYTKKGELNLFGSMAPETLFFAIHDPDNPVAEKYFVTIAKQNVSTIQELGQKYFTIIVRPDSIQRLDSIHVYVRDMTNTMDTVSVIVRYSYSPPTIISGPNIPSLICADSSYWYSIVTGDVDGHAVTVNTLHAPNNMVVSANGSIQWQPAMADTGIDSLVVQLSDQFTYSKPFAWPFAIVNCTDPRLPVKLQTSALDFPVRMQVGIDSIAVQLKTKLGTGKLPIVYNAQFTNTNSVVLSNSATGWLFWKPRDGDTGIQTLSVSVQDANNTADSILPMFNVLPRNQYPCSLSYTYTGTYTSSGALDLFSSAAPETLYFKINDKDNPLTEKYSRFIMKFGATINIDSSAKNFIVVLVPDTTKDIDSLRVSIEDKTGTTSKVVLAVRYRKLPVPLKLYLNTTWTGAATTSDCYGFPVLVRLNSSNFNFSRAQRNGNDIRFRKPNGTALPFEIERWDSTARQAEIWVKMDTVYGNNNTRYIDLYWLDTPAPSGSNSSAVFDINNGFRGVWHLGENANPIIDATANSYDGTRHGNQAQAAGAIGNGQRFYGNNTTDYTEMGNVLNPGYNNFTISAWVKKAENNSYQTIICKTSGGNPNNNYGWLFTINNANFPTCYIAEGGMFWGDPGSFSITSNTAITDFNSWHYVSVVINKSSNNNCKMYIDGNPTITSPNGNITLVGNLANFTSLRIGMEADNQWGLDGSLDEVVVSHTVRSADWIKLCYMNQKAVDALIEFR